MWPLYLCFLLCLPFHLCILFRPFQPLLSVFRPFPGLLFLPAPCKPFDLNKYYWAAAAPPRVSAPGSSSCSCCTSVTNIIKMYLCNGRKSAVFKGDESSKCDSPWLSWPLTRHKIIKTVLPQCSGHSTSQGPLFFHGYNQLPYSHLSSVFYQLIYLHRCAYALTCTWRRNLSSYLCRIKEELGTRQQSVRFFLYRNKNLL